MITLFFKGLCNTKWNESDRTPDPDCCGNWACGVDRSKWDCNWQNKDWATCKASAYVPSVGRVTCCNCFPSTARVSLENGNLVTMSELQIGDRVQAGTCMIFGVFLKFCRRLFLFVRALFWTSGFQSKSVLACSRLGEAYLCYMLPESHIW